MIFIKKEVIVIIELFKDNTQQDQLISIKVWQIWHSDYKKTIDLRNVDSVCNTVLSHYKCNRNTADGTFPVLWIS